MKITLAARIPVCETKFCISCRYQMKLNEIKNLQIRFTEKRNKQKQ